MSTDTNAKPRTRVSPRTEAWRPSKNSVTILLGLLLIYVTARCLAAAATTPLWYDEIITLSVASQPSVRDIWHALAQAVDGQPPLFYVIERVAMGVLRNRHISLRLPSIVSMLCTIVCTLLYVRRYAGEWVAFLSSIFLLSTTLFYTFAIQARPYSMLVACFALALICHQRLPAPWWAAFMGLALALAQSLHYYAIFGLFAFGMSEAAFALKNRSFRWPVWLALTFGVLPLPFTWPLLKAMRTSYGQHFWSHPGVADIPKIYGSFFLTGGAIGSAIASVCFVGIVGSRIWPSDREDSQASSTKETLTETVLLGSLLVVPLIAFVVSRLAHGGMVDKYVLESVLGIPLVLACLLRSARPGVVALFAVFVFTVVVLNELSFWRSHQSLQLPPPAAPVEKLVQDARYPDLPVVISAGLTYVEVAHYASPVGASLFTYLADERKAIEYAGTDSVDKDILVLRNYMPLRVSPLREFISLHPTFLMYTEEPPVSFDWLPSFLNHESASMRVLAIQGRHRLYLVTVGGAGTR